MDSIPGWGRSAPGQSIDNPYYNVRGASIHQTIRAVILAPGVFHGNSHWVQEHGRHFPCTGDAGCEYCRRGRGKRRKGYAAAMFLASKMLLVIEFTDKALDEVNSMLNQRGSLRGLIVHLSRKMSKQGERKRNAQVIVEFQGNYSGQLPEAFDELPHLLKMWGFADGKTQETDDLADDLADDLEPQLQGL